jgi:phospholipase D1/2
MVSKKIREFRSKLWREHFSFDDEMLDDPADRKLWTRVSVVSKSNTLIYRRLFGCYPDDEMKTLRELKEVKGKSSV